MLLILGCYLLSRIHILAYPGGGWKGRLICPQPLGGIGSLQGEGTFRGLFFSEELCYKSSLLNS